MRNAIVAISCLFVLAACGNNEAEIAAKKQELTQLRAQYKAVNAEYSEKHPPRQKVLDAVIPAKGALKRAQRSEDEAAIASAQQAFDEAQVAANEVIAAESELKRRIRDLKDKIAKAEKAVRKLGGTP